MIFSLLFYCMKAVLTVVFTAGTIENQCLVGDIKAESQTYVIVYRLQSGITELLDVIAFIAYKVAMLTKPERLFENCSVTVESMLFDEATFHQHVQGVVYRRPTNVKILFQESIVQIFDIKMVVSAIHLLQDGKALRCLTKVSLFQFLF